MSSRNTVWLVVLLALAIGCSKPSRTKKTPPPASTKPPARAVTTPKPATAVSPRFTETSSHDDEKLSLRVIWVSDGDTLNGVDANNTQVKVRLHGIDAPERDQAFGQASKKSLSGKVLRKDVSVFVMETDDYDRTVGRVFVGERDINLEQVKEGMAWHYKTFSNDPALAAAERDAREAKRGLWRDGEPLPPWEWRKGENVHRSGW